ncbi:branched-chain-amino-acid transaminase [Synchytrium microbalum]|uniref:Branched-chain-amino-acid aminotransferase n=1 Tax=Synchytrium microbalum TaxID=1806994 RepID=A0A507BXW4_9FUNG|nr:branched-chain-amino-acid transaminase [Synchytrium microbalum]TPX31968.1 branched-chain-amino-acid transaminase [Synchytrium microbalum]
MVAENKPLPLLPPADKPAIKLDSNCALIVVDLQNDFLPNGGSLGAPYGNRIIQPLFKEIRAFKSNGLPVFATRDWHPANHSSFAIFGGPWPVHCVQESWGSQYADGFPVDAIDGEVRKGVAVEGDAYSGFDKTDLDTKLKSKSIQKVFVTGIATEYCVKATATDAKTNGYEVYVLDDMIAGVNADDAVRAKITLQEIGCHVIQTNTDHHIVQPATILIIMLARRVLSGASKRGASVIGASPFIASTSLTKNINQWHHHQPAHSRTLATAPSSQAPIKSSNLRIQLSQQPHPVPANETLVFGRTFADHMLTIDWDVSSGWHQPKIQPYGPLSLDPSCTVFHYGVECFEGMKAYKDSKGKIRLFRPDKNMDRLWLSCDRLCLPTFDKKEVLECIKKLVIVDQKWIPGERGYSLYIRPTAIATQPSLGVGASSNALLFVISSPVGPYYRTGFAPVSLYATTEYVRAWPGGTGASKLGANYAPGIRPQLAVAAMGHQQNLWLFGPEHNITEVGTMNFFAFLKGKDGQPELVTPPLDGTILPGVTRDSILSLARTWGEFKVSERPITMPELAGALKEGRVLECFGAGTAAIVSPIKNISYLGKDLKIPLDPKDSSAGIGPLAKRVADTIMGIQYGEIPHEWSVVVEP